MGRWRLVVWGVGVVCIVVWSGEYCGMFAEVIGK